MSRNVTPLSNKQRQLGIVAGPLDEVVKAAIRNAGAGILGNGMDDEGFAALDEYLGDYLADCSTPRDCVEMPLALGVCADSKIGIAKCRRLTENRGRDIDRVIEGKCSNQRHWCSWVGCDPAR